MIKNLEELLKLAKTKEKKRLSVALAQDKDVLMAVKSAMEEGIVDPILIGDQEKIEEISKEIGLDLKNIRLINSKDKEEASQLATRLVKDGEADILMKGLVDTSIIMKAVLNRENGLRTDKVISHAAVFSLASYHKVFIVTDAAMNIAPDLMTKKSILENAIGLGHALDMSCPKVAVVGAVEKPTDKMPATLDAVELTEMNKRGEIKDALVYGPLALDNAVSKESAILKGIDSEVAGDVDIILVPYIEAGNLLYKSLSFLAGAESAGLILGAKAPIVLTSRADSHKAKLNSIALAVLMAAK